jgi:hypothetical protein
LAEQVASGELSLVKLREKIAGRPRVERIDSDEAETQVEAVAETVDEVADVVEPAPRYREGPLGDDALIDVKASLNEALDQLSDVFDAPQVLSEMRESDRQNLAKYLTISKLRLENAIIKVRNSH